ncbi:hypothetical protein Vretifemale_3685 [Volvox reticuliferus]|nr:hypothetical protein Vretifemale_3685 [Volvox reticuliferus]
MSGRNAFAIMMGAARRQKGTDGPAPQQSEPSSGRSQVAPKPAVPCSATGTQLHLDLGQRDFAVARCATCGMLYGKGLPEEDRLHDQFHNAHAVAFRFPGWVSERVVLHDGAGSRILCVIPSDPKAQLRKVSDVCEQLETVLGVPQGYLLAPKPPYKVFLYVFGGGSSNGSGKGRIIGVLIAQLQQRARRCELDAAAQVAVPPSSRLPVAQSGAAPLLGNNGVRSAGHASLTPTDAANAVDGGGSRVLAEVGKEVAKLEEEGEEAEEEERGGSVAKKRMRLMVEVTHGSAGAAGETHGLGGMVATSGGGGGDIIASAPVPAPPMAGPALPRHVARPAARTAGSGGGDTVTASSGKKGGCVRVVLGVRGLWVEVSWRRRGVARRLLDAARCCMVPGIAADRTGVAFSACAAAAASGDPDGGAAFTGFAAAYLSAGGGPPTATDCVLLYEDEEDEDKG